MHGWIGIVEVGVKHRNPEPLTCRPEKRQAAETSVQKQSKQTPELKTLLHPNHQSPLTAPNAWSGNHTPSIYHKPSHHLGS